MPTLSVGLGFSLHFKVIYKFPTINMYYFLISKKKKTQKTNTVAKKMKKQEKNINMNLQICLDQECQTRFGCSFSGH